MSFDDFPQTGRDAFYPQEQRDASAYLLLVEHPTLGAPIRFTNMQGPYDPIDKVYKTTIAGVEWLWAPFSITPPGEGPDYSPGKLRVPDLDHMVSRALDFADTPFITTLTAVLKSNPTVVLRPLWAGLQWRNVSGVTKGKMVEGDLVWRDSSLSPYPVDRLRLKKYKAMAMALE